jgi:glycogen debranching enzyme
VLYAAAGELERPQISLRGLLLTTGQYEAARQHILAFCSVIKHGLVPNLLDSLRTPRFNSRDSPWWLLQAIQDYTHIVPDGMRLLDDRVTRRFPLDDTWVPWNDERAYTATSTVAEVVQEILQRHAAGLHFREYNAGPNLDSQMRSEGFDIDIEVDWSTGFIHGGSAYNCGTWMVSSVAQQHPWGHSCAVQDKMGESDKAGNKGLPGTPRDGAPIEITGLLKSAVSWLDRLVQRKQFTFKGVEATRAYRTVSAVPRQRSAQAMVRNR